MTPPASATPSTSSCLWIPYSQDPSLRLSETILSQQASRLPDLSRVVVLLQEPRAARRLRYCLQQQAQELGYPALLAPRIVSLSEFVIAHTSPAQEKQFCDNISRELILVEALQQHPTILGNANPWALAEHLLSLFDELTLNLQQLPQSLEDFTHWLQQHYQLSGQPLTGLSREAELIHTLWVAWHTELEQRHSIDRALAYTQALQQEINLDAVDRVYVACNLAPSRSELHWLQHHLQKEKFYLCFHGQPDEQTNELHPASPLQTLSESLGGGATTFAPDSTYSIVLDEVFAQHRGNLAQRARQQAERYKHSPLQDRLSVLLANNAEQEVRAVDIQIRRWLLEGKTNIAVVCENRRLSRRLRALLERADITLEDTTGWALSTTSASATLERWLECIEEDFAYAPLLDLLASVFVFSHYDPIEYKKLIFRFEQDIIQNENIARDLQRYINHIEDRRHRLKQWSADQSNELLSLLAQLEMAAQPLLQLYQGRHRAEAFLVALQQSLQQLGAIEALDSDAAGRQLLQELEHLKLSTQQVPLEMDWATFRTWLGRHLEQSLFRPATRGQPVTLMGLAQTQWQCFDALIIAGAEQHYLPGSHHSSPFFNEGVRQELGLSNRTQHIAERFYHFRRLLESAPQVVITACREQDGEPIAISPWLERLLAFHEIAWGNRLHNSVLERLSQTPGAQVNGDPDSPLPTPPVPARAYLPADRLPQRFSASDYQVLMDCPYQYFAARSLSLSAPEEVRLALSKADYGSRIHQCLDALHTDRPDLPGPFRQPFDTEHRQAAIELLNKISSAVFARDLQDHFSHQGWLQKWQAQIPAYIDWEIARHQQWHVSRTELACENTTPAGIRLKGRIDRLDGDGDGYAVIDYKTGAVPKMDDVESGEKVQLPFYCLLTETTLPVTEVSYLALDPVNNKQGVLAGEQLQTLANDIQQRLDTMVEEMSQGQALSAWGDQAACRYCDMNRLCRRAVWGDERNEVTGE